MKTIQLPYIRPLAQKPLLLQQSKTKNQLLHLLGLGVFANPKQLSEELEIEFVLACCAVCRYFLIALIVLFLFN